MPNLAKKRTNRRTHFFLPKSAIFLVKSAHFLTPQTIFIAFLCINFFQISNFALFFLFSIAFFYIFLNKGLFCCFIKAHKNFSRRHQPFKGAPMCAKAHMFRNSGRDLAAWQAMAGAGPRRRGEACRKIIGGFQSRNYNEQLLKLFESKN